MGKMETGRHTVQCFSSPWGFTFWTTERRIQMVYDTKVREDRCRVSTVHD